MKHYILKIIKIFSRLQIKYYIYANKCLFYLHGIKYGKRMLVCNKIYLDNAGSITVGDDFWMTSGWGLNPICRNIRASIVTGSKEARIEFGNRVGISSCCIWARNFIKIGNDVNIGGDCLIMDHDAHPHDFQNRRRNGGG